MSNIKIPEDNSLYSNAFSFLKVPFNFNPKNGDADVVVTGVPFDLATTGRSGARLGPNAIRQASINLAWEHKHWPWNFSLRDRIKIEDAGDFVFEPGDCEEFREGLYTYALQLLKAEKTLLSLGGDHFISLPLLQAHAEKYGPLVLVHFDAHTDTYSEGGIFDHGTMFYHAIQQGLIVPEKSIQIGIRTEYEDSGLLVVDADQANEHSAEKLAALIIERAGDSPVYLSFDIDCLDPSMAPGTGTPVCGGLTTSKSLQILRRLSPLNLIGMDVVEVAPAYDYSEITALAAASIATELLYILANKK